MGLGCDLGFGVLKDAQVTVMCRQAGEPRGRQSPGTGGLGGPSAACVETLTWEPGLGW